MKYVRVTGTPDRERAPELFDLLANSSFVDEARLYDWNVGHDAVSALLEVDGEGERFRDEAVDTLGVQSVDTTRVSARRFTALVVLEPDAVPLLKRIVGTISRVGLVVAKPILYRDAQVHARIVGSADVLQNAVDSFPDEISLEISAIGDFDRRHKTPMSGLSDRQREALLAAFDAGYYECPRRATHEDVAERLGCAPNTASEHLQKAEIKLVTDVLQSEFER